jgi:diacylglycerol kinase (ATP)
LSSLPVPVIFNPIAGGGRLLRWCDTLETVARERGTQLEWRQTGQPGHGEELARDAAAAGRPLVLAFGGDGTYNEVARGLLGSSTALGVLPGGTTSVLAYELAVPRPPDRALAALLAGRDRPLRVGRTSQGQIFLLMLSAGPDAFVLERLSPRLKRLGGRLGVAVQAVLELFRREPLPGLRARWNGQELGGGWAIVGKGRCYGGRFAACPGADPFTPTLELVLQQRLGRPAAAAFFLGIAGRAHLRLPGVVRQSTSRVSLEPAPGSNPVPFQVDGDLVGRLPVEAWVDPEELRVRLPG